MRSAPSHDEEATREDEPMYEREVMPSLGGEGRGCASGVVAVDIGGGGAVETPLGWVGCLQLLQLLTAAPWRSFVCVGEVGWLVGWLAGCTFALC